MKNKIFAGVLLHQNTVQISMQDKHAFSVVFSMVYKILRILISKYWSQLNIVLLINSSLIGNKTLVIMSIICHIITRES